MSEEQQKSDIETIVEKAFDYFETFVARGDKLDSVLLEGLEPEGDGWVVGIGFNGKRQEYTEPHTIGALAGFGSKTTTTVREIRHIYLDKEGNFQKID